MTGVFGKCTHNSVCTGSQADAHLEIHIDIYMRQKYTSSIKNTYSILLFVANNRSKFNLIQTFIT
jgi:hypothetical protein